MNKKKKLETKKHFTTKLFVTLFPVHLIFHLFQVRLQLSTAVKKLGSELLCEQERVWNHISAEEDREKNRVLSSPPYCEHHKDWGHIRQVPFMVNFK